MHRHIPQPRQLVVQLQQRDRRAGHLERGDVVADELAGDRDAPAAEDLRQLVVDDVQLDQRRAAHAVHKREHLVARLERKIIENGHGQQLDDFGRRLQWHAAASRLAMDADTDFHLVRTQVERGRALGWHGARGERHAHRAAPAIDLLADALDLGQWQQRLGGAAANLLGQHGRAHAAPSGRVEAVLNGDVVVDHDTGHLDPIGCRQFGRHFEVHDVARVVFDDVQHACATVDGFGRLEHLRRNWRREDRARTRRVEHAATDEAAVHGLVTAAATRDEAHLALHRCVDAHHVVRVEVNAEQISVRRGHALERILDDAVRRVDELLHAGLNAGSLHGVSSAKVRSAPGASTHGRRG